jgi:hypothetical protein
LSGYRDELTRRLGRVPNGDENSLRLYQVWQETNALGWVLTRRTKGEHGAIELVLALDCSQRVCGVCLQRMREPALVSAALTDSGWLAAFRGKSAEDEWRLGKDLPQVPEPARVSAGAVVEGARSVLISLAIAQSNISEARIPKR